MVQEVHGGASTIFCVYGNEVHIDPKVKEGVHDKESLGASVLDRKLPLR